MRKRRSSYEYIVIFAVLVMTLALALGLFIQRDEISKGNVLMNELSQLRSSILLFNKLKGRHPKSLYELEHSKYPSKNGERLYLSFAHHGKEKEIIDPFGNPYIYDAKTGWVHSSTPDYLSW